MKYTAITAVLLLLLTACANSPTGFSQTSIVEPTGTISISVGADAHAILNPDSPSALPDVVARAWDAQQALNLFEMVEESVELVAAQKPASVAITQTWLEPLTAGTMGRSIPSVEETIEFALILQGELSGRNLKYDIITGEICVDCTVPMAVSGEDVITMRLVVNETVLINAIIP